METANQIAIKVIDLPILQGMESILSSSIGYPTSMSDEIEYYNSEQPMGWFIAQSKNGENIGFIRRLKQGSEWSLAELFVDKAYENRKFVARELLSAFLA